MYTCTCVCVCVHINDRIDPKISALACDLDTVLRDASEHVSSGSRRDRMEAGYRFDCASPCAAPRLRTSACECASRTVACAAAPSRTHSVRACIPSFGEHPNRTRLRPNPKNDCILKTLTSANARTTPTPSVRSEGPVRSSSRAPDQCAHHPTKAGGHERPRMFVIIYVGRLFSEESADRRVHTHNKSVFGPYPVRKHVWCAPSGWR